MLKFKLYEMRIVLFLGLVLLAPFLFVNNVQAFFIRPDARLSIDFNAETGLIFTMVLKRDMGSGFQDYNLLGGQPLSTGMWTTWTPIEVGLYELTILLPEDWENRSLSCTSTNAGHSFSYISNGMILDISTVGGEISCIFDNIRIPVPSKIPVLIIPGIMGTELYKDSEKLWPDISRMLLTKDDRFMDPLAFDVSGNSLDSNVSPLNVITKVDHLNKTVLDYTEKLINEFENQGYANNEVIFSLPYDWRKDLDSLAQNELKTKIDSILSTTRSTSIDIIAHSQGGLLIKRLLYKQPDYQAKINKLVFVGTPNLGAPKAAKALLYGDSMGVDFLGMGLDPEEIKRISQNTPSVYELLPSLEYFSHGQNYFAIAKTLGPLITGYSNLNYTETKQYLKDSGLNNNLIELAETFHTSDYDNYNFSTSGIKVSNIAGCQKASISQILAGKNGRFWLNYGPGDGTVPLISASNIFGATSYFAKNSNHGVMLTEDGTRQLIVNIISGSDLDTGDKITENSSECRFNGRQVSVHSPVELHIYDENGNHFGPSSNGNFDVQIPGVEYDILGEDKFAFLPEGQNYTLKLIATGSGTFDFYSSIIEDGQFMTKTFYNDVIITDSSQAVIDLSVDDSMNLDMDGNGVIDKVITYSSRLDAPQADDLINPSTTVDLDGVEGEPGYYRSDVSVNLTGVDDSSGILNTNYSLDGGISFTKFDSPLIFPSEGQYKLIYFSTDKAGNDEEWKFVDFVIDKTPPEFIIKFDLNKLDLSFSGKDEISDKVLLTDEDDKITVLDQAGNQTVIKLKEKDRKKKLKAEIVALEYNHIPTDISKTSLKFNWSIDKKTGSLRKLEQHIKSKQDFNIEASFNGNRTLIKGKDETGKIAQIIPGLYLLHINTHQGDFGWQ